MPATTSTPARASTSVPASPTVPAFPFVVENAFGSPDCTKTEVGGYLIDKSRQGLSGFRVKVGNTGGVWSTTSEATGADGKYSIRLYTTPTAGRWYVVVVDGAGKELSARTQIETNATNCGSEQSGIQVARIDFRKDY